MRAEAGPAGDKIACPTANRQATIIAGNGTNACALDRLPNILICRHSQLRADILKMVWAAGRYGGCRDTGVSCE
jgi:hypothetical protein